MKKTNEEKILTSELYDSSDMNILKKQFKYVKEIDKFNRTKFISFKRRENILKKCFAEIGENCYITPPLYSNFGCKHVHFGKGVYSNFSLTLVDDGEIFVGDYTLIGPNVTIATAVHPYNTELRNKGYQYNLSVKIGKSVWIGAGATILPGVTIGDNSIIGAGSIVAKDIPSNVVAVGNPCRVIKEITEEDMKIYNKDKRIIFEEL